MPEPIKMTPDMLDNLRGDIQESEDSVNLTLTKEAFMAKMLKEKDGWALLDLLEAGEWRIAERLGLIRGYYQDGKTLFEIPRWNNLVEHLRIVNSV